jgi:hypothetical protein
MADKRYELEKSHSKRLVSEYDGTFPALVKI